ncbi:heme ABC transporter ATP-binding protein [Nesterenkonia populi]
MLTAFQARERLPAPPKPVLQAHGLDFSVRGKRILHRVSARFLPGQLSIIIGPNGAGKSTLVSLLAGDESPQRGHADLFGQEVRRWTPKEAARRRSVMGQHTAVAFPFPAEDVIRMGRTPWRGTAEAAHDDDAVALAAGEAEVEHLLERPVTVLSGGERQRVALARTLAQRPLGSEARRPSTMMLDEPVSALDIRHAERTLKLLRRLADEGACVIAVLHDLDAAAVYADRLILMAEGRLVADGTAHEVCDEQLLSEVYRTPITVRRSVGNCLTGVGPRR